MESIAHLLEKLEAHEWRQKNIPIEAAESYPFLAMRKERLCLVVFYYVVTGPPRERSAFPARWLALITVEGAEILEFRQLRKEDFAFEVLGFEDDDEPVEVETGPPRYSYDDRVRKEEQLQEALQVIATVFGRTVRDLTAPLRSSARTYLKTLKELVSIQWRGYYLSLGKEFFIWVMDAVGGEKLIDPPPGARHAAVLGKPPQ